jgi:hypothetical protein
VKIGIPLLVIGVLMLLASIPYSAIMILAGFNGVSAGGLWGRILPYTPLAGVIIGFIMTTIGASRVFKN